MTTFKSLSDLSGRTALITGAAGGLGKVFAETLAELGCNLVLVDLPDTSLDVFAKKLQTNWSVTSETISCDLEKDADRKNLIKDVLHDYDQLSVLVNQYEQTHNQTPVLR